MLHDYREGHEPTIFDDFALGKHVFFVKWEWDTEPFGHSFIIFHGVSSFIIFHDVS